MRNAFKAGMGLVGAGVLAIGLSSGPAAAQLSDETARSYMGYAWRAMPTKFTPQNGKTIVIDKSKPNDVQIPMDLAKQIIVVAHRSARAQVCELADDQGANFQALGRRLTSVQLTPQQWVYSYMLHLTVVQLLAPSQAKKTSVDEKGQKQSEDLKPPRACTDEERGRIQREVAAYVSASPPAGTNAGSYWGLRGDSTAAASSAPAQTGSTTPVKK